MASNDRDVQAARDSIRREAERQRASARRDLDRQRWAVRREADRLRAEVRRTPAAPAGAGRAPAMPLDDVLTTAAAVVGLPLLALPLATGHLAAFLANGGWPRYRLSDVPGILGRLAGDPGDPGRAWEPVNAGAAVPGPLAWWLTCALLLACAGLLGLVVTRADLAVRRDRGWAGWREQRKIEVRRRDPGLVVGTNGPRRLALRDRHSLLVVGPAHSGKTSGLTIPALLEWPGPAVVASSKGQLVDQTIGWRSHHGDVHVFDPAGVTPYRRSGWSPLANCTSWVGAIGTAQELTAAAVAAVGVTDDGTELVGPGRGDLWRSSVAMAFAPFLFAAAANGRSIVDLVEWLERDARDEVHEILHAVDRAAARVLEMTFLQPDPARSRFLHLMQQILAVYRDPVVAQSADAHEIVPGELLDGGHHTLYLTAPEHDQARFRPLSAAVVRQILAAAYEQSAKAAEALRPPLLLVLDQVVGIAPVDDLAMLASTGAERGVQLVSVFQDLGQIEAHYGDSSGLLVKNHRAKLVLPSPHDADPDDDRERLLPPDLALRLDDAEGALLYGTLRPVRVRLRPWFRDRALRTRATTPQDKVPPAERRDAAISYVPSEQTHAWFRRGTPVEADPVVDHSIPVDESVDEIFGSLDDEETRSDTVTPLSEARRRRRRRQ